MHLLRGACKHPLHVSTVHERRARNFLSKIAAETEGVGGSTKMTHGTRVSSVTCCDQLKRYCITLENRPYGSELYHGASRLDACRDR